MKRRLASTDLIPINVPELGKKTAIHEAGHAAAIYLGNKQKQLPPVFFQLHIQAQGNNTPTTECLCTSYDTCTHNMTKIEGGRLIHTLPASVDTAISGFSDSEKQAYLLAYEADIINLLAGPLAEAYYLALRDDEPISPNLITPNSLHYYGGASDLESVNQYLACLYTDPLQQTAKLSELFLAAFEFVNTTSHWQAIVALADTILSSRKDILNCAEIMSVLDIYSYRGRNSAWC